LKRAAQPVIAPDCLRQPVNSNVVRHKEMEEGMSNKYVVISGAVFALIAILQAVRAAEQIPVTLGSFSVPVAASWVAALVAGCLSLWAFRSKS